MQFYVPTIGDRLYLAEDWTFDLYDEYRNDKLLETSGVAEIEEYEDWDGKTRTMVKPNAEYGEVAGQVTLPRKTELKVERIYIRGAAHKMRKFDSITFRIMKCPDKKLKGRFWVKLRDANKIVCSLYPVIDDEAYERMKALDQRFGHLDLE